MKELSEEEKTQIAELSKIFHKLGADDPESWAKSEITENIAQLTRFVFLRAAWRLVVSEDNKTWIDQEIDYSFKHPNDACSGIGPALQRLLDLGADRQDITDIVRVKQYEMLFNMCYLLDDPGELEPELGKMGWSLHEKDKNGKVTGRLVNMLHESALEMDPTGREMRPRSSESK